MKFNKIIRGKIKISAWMIFGLFPLYLFLLGFVDSSSLSIKKPNTMYSSCVQPYTVELDLDGTSTKSVDIRLFLSGYFSIASPYITLSSAISDGNIYAKYIGYNFNNISVQTGIASSGATYLGWGYLYLNGSTLFNQNITGHVDVATLYLKGGSSHDAKLDFYYVTGWNGDDSNISSGINEGAISGTYTLYEDSLSSVTNISGSFNLTDLNLCDSRPYISGAVYRQTGYISTNYGVQAVWTSVAAGPLYSGTNNWTVWTKEDVKLYLTGISDSYNNTGGLVKDGLSTGIQFNNEGILNNSFYISPINFALVDTGWHKQYHQFLITGNLNGNFVFENILGNTGNRYYTGGTNYNNLFNIDVFWIDTTAPNADNEFTGFLLNTGVGYTTIRLSGANYNDVASNSNGWHASWTTMDDQYKVISFSGTNSITQNCTDLGYACSPTGYMTYMNSTSGYLYSGNNDFKMVHDIVFTTSFSGYVTVMDRAGNTGEVYVEVNMDDLLEIKYGLIAYPQAGVVRNSATSLSGMLMKLAIYSGGFDPQRLLGSGNIELVYTGWIKTSSTGYAYFTGNFSSGQYWVLAQGVNTLSYLISGINLNPIGGLIDFRIDYPGGFEFGDLYGTTDTLNSKHATYLSNGSNRDEEINITDLARLVTIWGEYSIIDTNPEIGVYSGEYFVDKPINGTGTKIDSNLLQQSIYTTEYMQYHPYDINANGQVNNIDYNVMLLNMYNHGATYLGQLNGTTSATMPF